MKATIIKQSDLGTECWSTVRIVRNDCTKCDRHVICKYSVKGKYPKPDRDQLYQTQLAMVELKKEDSRGDCLKEQEK